jgi:hypothetical protein
MSSELLYTSAPKGLRHGSRGFCTVLTTAGMPINVISRLEALSGYRPLFPPGTPQANRNPVAFSHQRLVVGGNAVTVLSRIAAYGTDYSGRDNKLAHHVTLEPSEFAAAGPAWVIRQRSVMRTEWLGQCETPPSGPVIPRGDQQPRICSGWKSVAGDAGWGGVIAEAFASEDRQPLWVIYSLDHQQRVLELVDESISLLPVELRWQATFNTYAVNVPPDVDCKLRMVPAESREANKAPADGKTIDLTKSPSITSASTWVERARGVLRESTTTGPESGGLIESSPDPSVRLQSAWESPADAQPASPPPLEPPELPPEALRRKGISLPTWFAIGVLGLLVVPAGLWSGIRLATGKSIFPGSATATAPLSPQVDNIASAARLEPEPTDGEIVTKQQDVPLHYDQKQLLAWVIGSLETRSLETRSLETRRLEREPRDDESTDSDQSVPQRPVSVTVTFRGYRRLQLASVAKQLSQTLPDEDKSSQPATEASAGHAGSSLSAAAATPVLVAWGGEPLSIPEPKKLRVQTHKLSNTTGVFPLSKLPDVPAELGQGTAAYWNPETNDLIVVSEQSWGETADGFADQATAYRELRVALAEMTRLLLLIRKNSESLPNSLREMTAPLGRWTRGGAEETAGGLIRSLPEMLERTKELVKIGEDLQTASESLQNPLAQAELSALLRIVSDCQRAAERCKDLRRVHKVLQNGCWVEVPELVLLDAEGTPIHRVPLRFHFSW